jgi:hypothetical protein
LVTVVQTAHCGPLDYFALGDELYSSGFRGVFAQRQMRSPVGVWPSVAMGGNRNAN